MSRFISATLGRFSPRYRTFDAFVPIFRETLVARGLSEKTLANHDVALRQLSAAIGRDIISSIRPHKIAIATRELHLTYPHAAQRMLSEARAAFAEAVALGWSNTNPAIEVRMPVAKIARQRLTLDEWRAIADYALKSMPPWVHRMIVLALITAQRRGDLVRMQFDDVREEHLQICQQKTGTMLRLPLDLRLEAVDMSLREAIESCRTYSKGAVYLLRKSTGAALSPDSLSARFETAREAVLGKHTGDGAPPSLHECRSLAERLYRDQGINTQRLLGHTRQKMTDVYNDDRGLTGGQWKTLEL
jgi:integrase